MTVEERLAKLEAIVENMRDNHLHTIEKKIDRLDSRHYTLVIGIVFAIVVPVVLEML